MSFQSAFCRTSSRAFCWFIFTMNIGPFSLSYLIHDMRRLLSLAIGFRGWCIRGCLIHRGFITWCGRFWFCRDSNLFNFNSKLLDNCKICIKIYKTSPLRCVISVKKYFNATYKTVVSRLFKATLNYISYQGIFIYKHKQLYLHLQICPNRHPN